MKVGLFLLKQWVWWWCWLLLVDGGTTTSSVTGQPPVIRGY